MIARQLGNRVLLAAAVAAAGMAALSVTAIAAQWKPTKEVTQTRNRMNALRAHQGLSKEEKQKNLAKLEAIGREIEQKWRDTDVETYARLTLQACGTFGAIGVGTNPRRGYMVRHFAMRALEKADEMPLNIECRLIRNIGWHRDIEGKLIEGEARAQLRKKQATLWLHGWQRIDKTIDKNWDPNDTGVGNVTPPDGMGPAGVDPRAIEDPKLRAEYEAAIEANRRKIERNTLQHRARDLKKHWRRDALRFLILAYLAEPDGTAELRELLEQYVSQGEIRAKILNAVATRKMPPGLWRSRPTATQPAGVALPTLTIDGAQIDTGSRPPATMPAGDQSANGQ